MSLLRFYNEELTYLRKLGADFARWHPETARRLQLGEGPCSDPHVERLLEGFAFLTARIRMKLEDEYPEIGEGLLGLLHPEFLRPLPPMTIAQLRPDWTQENLRSGHVIERGSVLKSKPVSLGKRADSGEVACEFQTRARAVLWPIDVADAEMRIQGLELTGQPRGTRSALRVRLTLGPGTNFGDLNFASDKPVRFYLDGDESVARPLYELIFAKAIGARLASAVKPATFLSLGPEVLEPGGLNDDEAMLPDTGPSFSGYARLLEYFAFPQKFLFVDLRLHDLMKRPAEERRALGGSIDLWIFFNEARPGMMVDKANIRLHATTAVNVFEGPARPVELDQTATEYPVLHADLPIEAAEAYAVRAVSSQAGARDARQEYRPFYAPWTGMGKRPFGAERFWHEMRRVSPRPFDADGDGTPTDLDRRDPGTDLWIGFVDGEFRPNLPEARRASLTGWWSNRNLAPRIPLGRAEDIADLTLARAGPVRIARCLTTPTDPIRPPLDQDVQWRLVSLLTLNYLSLTGDDSGRAALVRLLELCDFGKRAGNQLNGIGPISSTTAHARGENGRGARLGVQVIAPFRRSDFPGNSPLLLATVLDRFLAMYVSINSFTRLSARIMTGQDPSRWEILKEWKDRSGARNPI